MIYNIGDKITYMSGDCDPLMGEKIGEITEISSDNFDDVKIEKSAANGSFFVYWSKKTKRFRPGKEKDMKSIYYTVESRSNFVEYIEPHMITGYMVNQEVDFGRT